MQEIVAFYLEKYLPRKDIIHRLPVSLPISKAWPKIQSARREKSEKLPLLAANGEPFWWVLTDRIIEQSEEVLSLARRELVFDRPEYEEAYREALLDEAVYSSIIEGAFTTKKDAREFIEKGREPKNKSEQMVKNNYEALTYVLERIDSPVTEQTVFDIYALVTKATLEEEYSTASYRNDKVFVQTAKGDIIHFAPSADKVPEMMASLLSFIRESELSPLIKACIVHFYFVYVHPFFDGNRRTARALSYMILLQAGYDFFRYFSISGVIADERAKYYKAIKDVEDDDFDMTYFIDYYTAMLARAVKAMEQRLFSKAAVEQILEKQQNAGVNGRILAGAKWLLESPNHIVTIKAWQNKFHVSTETARQDLFKLEAEGVVVRKVNGKRFEFEIVRQQFSCQNNRLNMIY